MTWWIWFLPLITAIQDRIRGGFPGDEIWTDPPLDAKDNRFLKFIGVKWPEGHLNAPRWKHWFRKIMWYLSGTILSIIAIGHFTWWALLSGIIFAQGERQDMGVLGKFVRDEKGKWLAQLRIGAVWCLFCIPFIPMAIYINPNYWLMFPAMFFSPILGALTSMVFWKPLKKWWQLQLKGQWAWMELYRGLWAGLIVLLLTYVN